MNCALSRAAGATSGARQAAPTPRLAGKNSVVAVTAPLSIRSNVQLSRRRRLGDALIVRNELNKWCVSGRVAIAGWAGSGEGPGTGCFGRM